MGFRPTPEIRASLERAAQANGRSMSQEVQARLERSFLVEDHLTFVSGDPKTAWFVREMLEAKRLIEAYQEKSAWDDFECHEAMKAAINRLLTKDAPKPTQAFKKKRDAYKRYKEKTLRPWWDKGGGGLFSNPNAGPQPTLKLSPDDHARAVGREAAHAVRQGHLKALAEALRKGKPKEDR